MNESLFQQIRNAFPDGQPPERPITGHRCDECDEVDAILGGHVWSKFAINFPVYCHDAFPLLTPVAQAYYLPAYMIAAFLPGAGCQGVSVESALKEGNLDPNWFTFDQRLALVAWGQAYWADEGVPDEIVEKWKKTNS